MVIVCLRMRVNIPGLRFRSPGTTGRDCRLVSAPSSYASYAQRVYGAG
jgi:hypothetical protein